MQNRYTGDVGDFGKYGLLKHIVSQGKGMKLGVNWYLAADESHNNDGKHINYLNANVQKNLRKFKACDPELYDQLGLIVRNKSRAVKTVQESRVLPSDTVFYDKKFF